MRTILAAAFLLSPLAVIAPAAQASDPVKVEAESMRTSSQRHLTVVAKVTNTTGQAIGTVWYRCALTSGGKVVAAPEAVLQNLRPFATVFTEVVVDKFPNATVACEFARAR